MSTRTFKVSLGENIVRFSVELNTGASPQTTLDEIRAVAVTALGLAQEAASQLVLKYTDDEGDLCTLTSMTLEDLMGLCPQGPIRLVACLAAQDTHQNEASLPMDEACEQPPSGKDVDKDSSALPTDAPRSNAEAPPNPMAAFMASMAVQHIPMWLPSAALALQDPDKQAELNRVGVERREKLVPLCVHLLGRLDALEEARGLKPALQAYIDGSDAQNLGVFVSELLQAFSAAINNSKLAIVQDIVRDVLSSYITTMMPAQSPSFAAQGSSQHGSPSQPVGAPDLGDLFGLLSGKGMGKGMGNQPPSEAEKGAAGADLGAMLGSLFAAKGMGKGKGMPTPSQGGTTGPDLSALLGGMCAGKGLGKGMGMPTASQAGSTEPDLGALLGGVLGGKGCSGVGMPTPAQAGNTGPDLGALLGDLLGAAKGMGKGAGMGGDCNSSHQAANGDCPMAGGYSEGAQSPGPQQPDSPIFEEQVQDLLDMGLVTDAEVARDLLRVHNGDLASVVAMLATD